MLAKSRSLITSPRARIFRLFTQTRYQGPNWLGLHACVTGVHCTVRRLKTQHPHAPAAAPGARAVPARGGAPAPPAGAPAADRAAALWQLCCRIGTTTTIACQVVDSRARCHRVQMATVVERGANAGTARRARDGRRAYPANRHRVCIRTRSCVRRLTISIAVGAAFGYDTRAHALSRTLTRREASQCAVRPQSGHASRAGATPRASWCLWEASCAAGVTSVTPPGVSK